MADVTGKVYSIEGEAAVLGSMILDNVTAVPKAMQVLTADDFCKSEHGTIYKALCGLHIEIGEIDLVILRNRLTQLNVLDEIGGVDYLVRLCESVPVTSNVTYYANIVKDAALSRSLVTQCNEMMNIAQHNAGSAEERTLSVMEKITELAQICSPPNTHDINNVAEIAIERIDLEPVGHPLGFPSLDSMIGCVEPGDLIIIGANPSMGKTSLALSIARKWGKKKRHVAIYSLEMLKTQLVDRFACMEGRVDLLAYRTRRLLEHQRENVLNAMEEIKSWPIKIIEQPGISAEQVYTHAMSLNKLWPIDMIIVDYLQIMGGSGEALEKLQRATRMMKTLAQKMECPVLLLSQLNRSNVQGGDNRPRLHNLRGSGSIEEDADIALMIHREDYYNKNDPHYEPNGEADVIIAKQRQGATGVVQMDFIGEYALFEDRNE